MPVLLFHSGYIDKKLKQQVLLIKFSRVKISLAWQSLPTEPTGTKAVSGLFFDLNRTDMQVQAACKMWTVRQ